MQLSFAPMEGLTSHIFRCTHSRLFGGADEYYSPFIAPDGSGRFKGGSLRDVLPENNVGLKLVPQILVNKAEPFLVVARELQDLGYEHVNLNAGCPSPTVVPKHKGAGMLADLRSLDNTLADIFSRCEIKVSVKTRLGLESTEEFPRILEIYNKYPIHELIIHARDRKGMYKSPVDTESFIKAFEESRAPVCYNGDIFSPEQLISLKERLPGLDRIMLGRGAVANPALFRQLRGGKALEKEELKAYHDALLEAFEQAALGDRYTFGRLKELWFYFSFMFADCSKEVKRVYKSRDKAEYVSAVDMLFSCCELDREGKFNGNNI